MFGHLNLILRSRRIQACAAIAAFAALVVWAGAFASIDPSAKLLFVGVVLLGAMFGTAVIVARMATVQQAPPPDVSPRLRELAVQLQASDINVARLAARLERNLSTPELSKALDVIAERLNALENSVNESRDDGDHRQRLLPAIDRLSDRLNAIENVAPATLAARLEARMAILEDQLCATAADVERLTRRES